MSYRASRIAGGVALLLGSCITLLYLVAFLGIVTRPDLSGSLGAAHYPVYFGLPAVEVGVTLALGIREWSRSNHDVWRVGRVLLITVWAINLLDLALSFTGIFGFM